MSVCNGVAIAKDGNIFLKRKTRVNSQCDQDPELQAEIRWAKENDLPVPSELPSEQARGAAAAALEQERKRAAALSTRNRSKSTSEVFNSPKLNVKSTKADRKARNRGVSGSYSRKADNYDYDDYEDDDVLDYDMQGVDLEDDAIADDDYEDITYTFDESKVSGALREFFNNGSIAEALTELTPFLYNKDSSYRLTRELVRQSLDYDHSRVVLGHRLMIALLKAKYLSEQTIASVIEDVLLDLENLIKDAPHARQFLALFVAKTIADGIMARIVFDEIMAKLEKNRHAMSAAVEVYTFLNNRATLKRQFEAAGGYEPLSELHEQFEKCLREFETSGDIFGVVERLRYLHVAHFHHVFVYLVGIHAMESMRDQQMDKFVLLLKHLMQTGFLLNSCLPSGFKRLFNALPDIYIDLPAAFTLCQLWVKKCIEHSIIDDEIARQIPQPSAQRARTLSEGADGKYSCIDCAGDAFRDAPTTRTAEAQA